MRPLQHLKVAAQRRVLARILVPRKILGAAQRLQRLEISDPRSRSAQETLVRQSTSSAQTLERAQVSAEGGIIFFELLHPPSGRVHRGAHAFAHGAKHREVRGVGQVFFDERTGDIEGQARDRDTRLRGEDPLSLARARHGAARCLGDHRAWCRVHRARRCARCARDLRFENVIDVRFRRSHTVTFARFSSTWTRRRRLFVWYYVVAALVASRFRRI
jgi:hypothetical protein